MSPNGRVTSRPQGRALYQPRRCVRARYLVSRDHHLLDLMQAEQFRQSHPGLAILNPVAFLQEIALTRQREQTPVQDPERERGRDINH